ncbi:hypothetical protein SeMB42_g06310 [Synchytrium endobioticum]|uniref:Uncharacterized protein n=1 Tax=Synchytrium endobioticum TaxID=286115 RepID=A0A507CM49_9FUNG|nr:hypothetical protein SeMB42_g06310 [Synchytrium endobioticum]
MHNYRNDKPLHLYGSPVPSFETRKPLWTTVGIRKNGYSPRLSLNTVKTFLLSRLNYGLGLLSPKGLAARLLNQALIEGTKMALGGARNTNQKLMLALAGVQDAESTIKKSKSSIKKQLTQSAENQNTDFRADAGPYQLCLRYPKSELPKVAITQPLGLVSDRLVFVIVMHKQYNIVCAQCAHGFKKEKQNV